MAAASARGAPLQGVRILDMTRILAGPYCTMLLADLGADVIKIERPGSGDDTRAWGPPFVGTETAYFLSVNRSKRSVAVDIKSEAGKNIILDLARSCDVLVENYLPGKLESLGLGYDAIAAVNSGLVYASISGFGSTGPYAHRAGYDVAAAAMGGLMSITGPEDGPACKVGVAVTDLLTGLHTHGAILAALRHRDLTGHGQHIDTSLLECQVASLANIGSNVLIAGEEPKRQGTAHSSIVPYQTFETRDGREAVIAAMNDAQWQKLALALGREDWAGDDRYKTNAGRVRNRAELIPVLAAELRKYDRVDLLPKLERAGLAVAPVNTVREAFDDPQVRERDMVQSVVHPTLGPIEMAGVPVKYSSSQLKDMRAPPTLGQHTVEVLQDVLTLSPTEISKLRDQGVIQTDTEGSA